MDPRTTDLGEIITYGDYTSFKQNLSPAWILGPQTQGKLLLMATVHSFKQNQSPAWLLGPQTLGKLLLMTIYTSFKQNLSPAWILGPQTQGKLLLKGNYYLEVLCNFKVRAWSSVIATLIQIRCTASFFLVRLYLFMSLQTFKKKKEWYQHTSIDSKASIILIFRGQYKERSLQKNAKTGRLSFKKKKGNTKIKSLKAKP